MSEQISQERIEAVARWLGFRVEESHHHLATVRHRGRLWKYPQTNLFAELPDFPNDIAACFKWIVPKLIEDKWSFTLRWSGFPPGKPSCSCSYWGGKDNKQERPHIQKVAESPATAIFLIAEQLMEVSSD